MINSNQIPRQFLILDQSSLKLDQLFPAIVTAAKAIKIAPWYLLVRS